MSAPTARALAVLSVLQAGRAVGAAELAARLGVTERTVRRDVERLRGLGYAVVAAPGVAGGYRLSAGTDLPPLRFDDEQALAVAIALGRASSSGAAIADGAARALGTLATVLPSRLRHRLAGVRFENVGGGEPVSPGVIVDVAEAVAAERTLRFVYAPRPGAGGEAERRHVEPHGVVARHGRWYLVGWDRDRRDWRRFRLDRVEPRPPLGGGFARRAVPAGGASAFVEAGARGAASGTDWPAIGVVEIDLPPAAVAPWLGDAVIESAGEHACVVRVGSWSDAGVLAWVARFDAPFRVVGPPSLRRAAATLAERAARAAADDPDERVEPHRRPDGEDQP